VSRQLWWGHQIPAWYGPDRKVFVAYSETEAKAEARQHYGKDVPLQRDPDVLDTWFSSGLWAFSTLGWPEKTPELQRYYPTDVLVTGFDIIFFWVARMMMLSLHFMKDVPFRQVYIHALVRDAKGQKMSKSKGNVMDPLELIDKFGADALRFTLTVLAVPGRDIKLSESRVEGYRNFATKLWNAARYAEMNGCAVPAEFDPAAASLSVNRWVLGELRRTAASFEEALATFRFNDAAGALYKFLWNNFCDWYLEFTKPVLQGPDEAAKAETRAVTAWVLRETLKLLHPLMPYITEELWERQGGQGMLIVAPWPELASIAADKAADDEMGWIIEVISQIRTLRSEMNVPAAARLALSFKDATLLARERLERHRGIVMTLARLESIDPAGDAVPKGAVQLVVPDATLLLPLAGVIDAAAERARLRKEIGKLEADIAGIDRKLANQDFIAKADPEIVEENRERRADAEAARTRLATAMQRLEGL
jgi:valyl-tRNA synthetase